jgi:PAS domain S-box-containing protein
MRGLEIQGLVDSTADPAFAVDAAGVIIAANAAAAALFGSKPSEAIGLRCWELAKGADERGPFCSEHCAVRQTAQRRRGIGNFDLLLQTKAGPRWYNVSIMVARDNSSAGYCAIHVMRDVDTRKRLENLVREFVITSTRLPHEEAARLLATSRAPARLADLTRQELAILRLLAKGCATRAMARELHISPNTVNNHIQHILSKLDVHTRLEAIRRAERAGLI